MHFCIHLSMQKINIKAKKPLVFFTFPEKFFACLPACLPAL